MYCNEKLGWEGEPDRLKHTVHQQMCDLTVDKLSSMHQSFAGMHTSSKMY
jgi:hypothetical protein